MEDTSRDKNDAIHVRFSSIGMDCGVLVVVVLLDQIHEMLSQGKNYDQLFWFLNDDFKNH
jgi:Na+-translocating ferredoxin:NAD+ oxidoreductase RnfE subunit